MRAWGFAVAVVVLLSIVSPVMAAPPALVSSKPANGVADVPVDVGAIVLEFDRDMRTGSHTCWTSARGAFPPLPAGEKGRWRDPRHFELRIARLEPGKTYALQLNSAKSKGFRAEDGTPLPMTEIVFTAKPLAPAAPKAPVAKPAGPRPPNTDYKPPALGDLKFDPAGLFVRNYPPLLEALKKDKNHRKVAPRRLVFHAPGKGFRPGLPLEPRDGGHIVYTRCMTMRATAAGHSTPVTSAKLHVMNGDGSGKRPFLVPPDYSSVMQPRWSSRYDRLTFSSNWNVGASACMFDIFTMRADGAVMARVTGNESRAPAGYGSVVGVIADNVKQLTNDGISCEPAWGP